MTLQPTPPVRPTVFLVAIDFEEDSIAALRTAFDLASKFKSATVHAIHVVSPLAYSDVAPLALIDFHREAKLRLDALLVGLQLDQVVEPHVHVGKPGDVIVRAAETLHADFLVLGTHGRRGVSRLLMGSVAESVTHNATCSVIVVRERSATAATDVEIEAPCAECLKAAAESGGTETKCARHRVHHPRAHVYTDNSGTDTGLGSLELRVRS